jgi:hypothetical protein
MAEVGHLLQAGALARSPTGILVGRSPQRKEASMNELLVSKRSVKAARTQDRLGDGGGTGKGDGND